MTGQDVPSGGSPMRSRNLTWDYRRVANQILLALLNSTDFAIRNAQVKYSVSSGIAIQGGKGLPLPVRK